MKNIFFIIAALIIMIYMFISIRKNRLDVTQSFIWIMFCIIMLILSIWPKCLDWLASLLGITYPPALFLSVAVVILFILIFIQSKKIVDLQKKVLDLGRELSVVKSEKNGKK